MAVIGSGANFLDVRYWYARLAILEHQVCQVEVFDSENQNGSFLSSGFLVAPDIILTTFHTVEPLITSQMLQIHESTPTNKTNIGVTAYNTRIRFDYVMSAQGEEINPGTEYQLAKDNWLIEYSKYPTPNNQQGHEADLSELDFALLRVQGNPGLDKVGVENTPRGWVELVNYPEKIEPHSAISIIQHPNGQPLRISMDTSGVIGYNSNKTRLLYTASTQQGSSGAPCFNINWQLLAMHIGWARGNRHNNIAANQGIPIQQIIRMLRDKNLLDIVSQKSPHKVSIGRTVPETIAMHGNFVPDPEILRIISDGESQRTEFKVSAHRYQHDGGPDKRIRHKITRTVAAFMNSETAGTLFIGVSDDGNIIGINADYQIVDKRNGNWDSYRLFIRNLLTDTLSIENPFSYFEIAKHEIEGKDICVVNINPAPKPVYIKKRLYVRTGAQSRELLGPDLIDYVKNRWMETIP